MTLNYSNWLEKLKIKYREVIDSFQSGEYNHLVTNYRFEGSTLLFIFEIELQSIDITLLIVNHDPTSDELCKYFGLFSVLNKHTEVVKEEIKLKIHESEELRSIEQDILNLFENQLKIRRNSRGKGEYLGGGTIGRPPWYWFLYEGRLDDISIDNFFTNAVKDAKDRYQMKIRLDENIKNRKISVESVEPLDIHNSQVKEFLEEVRKDLENIKKNLSDKLKNAFSNCSVIVENDSLEKFEFFTEHSRACKLFAEILPISDLTIQGDLDSRRFRVQIRGLYGYLIEEVLHKFITNPQDLDNYILQKINEFILSYKTKQINYTIILPINGIIAKADESFNSFQLSFTKNAGLLLLDDIIVITKNSDFILTRSMHYTNDIISGINRAISIYCNGTINFNFVETNSFLSTTKLTEPESINKSNTWSEIRNLFSSFVLTNFKLGYSKQFYKFPWWIPKRRYQYDFPAPDWLRNLRYFNPSENMSIDQMEFLQIKHLVPESYRNITHFIPIDKKDTKTFPLGNISSGSGLFRVIQGKSHEMGFQEIDLQIPSGIFQLLIRSFKIYSDKSKVINFYTNQFIIKQIILLRLHEKIEEAIINSCLIIESLLVGGNTELSYQFRLHASLLISNDLEDFQKKIRFFKDLYNLRSEIVHGEAKWHKKYRKFLNNHTRWNFSDYDWNNDLISLSLINCDDQLPLRFCFV
jgi:hypothetical protein